MREGEAPFRSRLIFELIFCATFSAFNRQFLFLSSVSAGDPGGLAAEEVKAGMAEKEEEVEEEGEGAG